jgi:hypothetical protein
MSPIVAFISRLAVCAATIFLPSSAGAAVLILEGAPPPAATPPAAPPTPDSAVPREEPPVAAPAMPPTSTAPSESGIPGPVIGPTTVQPPAAAVAPDAPAPQTDLGTVKVANSAEVSLEMMPGQTLSVGSRVSFRVTSKKAGYLVLVDVDATGHLTQIYPNTASLVRTSKANGNYIKPGGTLTIPLATDPYAGIQYVVSPPNGQAMIVAILSALPVQMLDLPDVTPDFKDRSEILPYLSKWMNELRIPDDASQLREAKWSLNAKPYTIK